MGSGGSPGPKGVYASCGHWRVCASRCPYIRRAQRDDWFRSRSTIFYMSEGVTELEIRKWWSLRALLAELALSLLPGEHMEEMNLLLEREAIVWEGLFASSN